VPAPYDQFLAPACQPEIAQSVLPPEIAGVEQARPFNIDPQIRVLLWIEIAREKVGPTDDCAGSSIESRIGRTRCGRADLFEQIRYDRLFDRLL
jgi:hypothetical protein